MPPQALSRVQRADAAAYEWNFSYAYTSEGVDPVPTAERKKARAEALRKAHPEYGNAADLASLLDAEAAQLTAAIFEENVEDGSCAPSDLISKKQLTQWAAKETETSRKVMHLNEVFAKAAEKKA